MDVFARRQAMKNLASGNFTEEDVRVLSESSPSENYGEREQLVKEDVSGRKVSATYRGNTNSYFVPSDGAWISGKGISMERAYRVFEEDDKTMQVGKVQDFSELESIAEGMRQEIRRILNK